MVHCGDKFTTIIGHTNIAKLNAFGDVPLPSESYLKSSSSKSEILQEKEKIDCYERNHHNEKKKAKKNEEEANINTHHSVSSSTKTAYHNRMEKIIETIVNYKSDSISTNLEIEDSKEGSSRLSNIDVGNVVLSLIARVSELQVASLVGLDSKKETNICNINNYLRAEDGAFTSCKRKREIISNLPYGIECTNTAFSSLLSLLEEKCSIFCYDISTVVGIEEGAANGDEKADVDQEKEEESEKEICGEETAKGDREEDMGREKEKAKEKEKEEEERDEMDKAMPSSGHAMRLDKSKSPNSTSSSVTCEMLGGRYRRRRAGSNIDDMNLKNNYLNNDNNDNNSHDNHNNNNVNCHDNDSINDSNNNNYNDDSNNNNDISRCSSSSVSKAKESVSLFPSNFSKIGRETLNSKKNHYINKRKKDMIEMYENEENLKDDENVVNKITEDDLIDNRKILFTTFGSLMDLLTVLKSNLIVLSLQIADNEMNRRINNYNNGNGDGNYDICNEATTVKNNNDDNICDDNNDSSDDNNKNNDKNTNNINNNHINHNNHHIINAQRNSYSILENINDVQNFNSDTSVNPRSLSPIHDGSRGGIFIYLFIYLIIYLFICLFIH